MSAPTSLPGPLEAAARAEGGRLVADLAPAYLRFRELMPELQLLAAERGWSPNDLGQALTLAGAVLIGATESRLPTLEQMCALYESVLATTAAELSAATQ